MGGPAERRDQLFDFAHARPGGFTSDAVMHHFGWSSRQTSDAIRSLREFLGDFDEINLPCTPNGPGERWTYRLTDNHEESAAWVSNRVKDTTARLRTIHAVTASTLAAADRRTVAGRHAVEMEMAIRHLLENIDTIR